MTRATSSLLIACCLLSACAGWRAYTDGREKMAAGDSEGALAKLEEAVKAAPNNFEYRQTYEEDKGQAVARWVSQGDLYRGSGDLDRAETDYRKALRYDPANKAAQVGLGEIAQRRKNLEAIKLAQKDIDAGALDQAEQTLKRVIEQDPSLIDARTQLSRIYEKRAAAAASAPPALKSAFTKPITLEFRDATLKTVFEVISRTSGINFVFDRDVRSDTKVNMVVRNSSLDDVVKLILLTNQLDRRLLNENSVLVYPNTPAKQKEYRELVVRSFYLANADVKQAVNLVKGMVKTQDVFIDEKLNLMVVKDTPEAVSVVERLVRSLDLAEPEVMLELSVLEVSRTRMQTLGLQWPTSISYGNPALSTGSQPGTGTPTPTPPANIPLNTTNGLVWFTANPAIVVNLLAQDADNRLLANPKVRVKNREKAKVHIGQKVPVITTTSTANVGVSSSVSYLDTGLKLDVEPNIYLRDEVAIKVGLEVSNITQTLNINGTVAYQLGTRNAATTLQIKDGETQILAGLIQDDDRVSAQKVPGLGDIPIIGRLFRNQTDDREKTEIILLITPRIVRSINWPQSAIVDTPVGTDSSIGSVPLRIAQTSSGALALAPAQGGGAARQAAAPTPAAPGPGPEAPAEPVPGLLIAVPLAAKTGTELLVSLGVPPGTSAVGARVELAFDPSQLQPLGVAPSAPGRVPVKVEGAASVRFKVVAAPGTVQVRAENVVGIDAGGGNVPMQPPAPVDITVTP
ncbi:MAG TPA: secretin N-terminal domain-containing protein [Burkholderiales bacterium]|nr:secretin N-terminal domain-containing protein [Burkholderiales bacterium]